MIKVEIDLADRSYPVLVGSNLLQQAGELLPQFINGKQLCIVTNEVVAPLYLATLENQLSDYQLSTIILPDGEKHKNFETLNLIFDHLLANKLGRNTTLVALGGGVIGDMTGFAAACFMRGVDFIQIPTTLLAQVDSSVGGKTAVNHPLGKNMIGAFYQPKCVLADIACLSTLPDRELSAGLAEVVKYGLIADPDFHQWLIENSAALFNRDESKLARAVEVSCQCKARVVAEDEKEKGLRAILNLGHTFGHAIEAHYQYKGLLHGEAVAIGMCMAAFLSKELTYIDQENIDEIESLLEKFNLPTKLQEAIDTQVLMDYMGVDKKAVDGKVRFVVMEQLGRAIVVDGIEPKSVEKAIKYAYPKSE